MVRYFVFLFFVLCSCTINDEISEVELDALFSNEFMSHEISDENVSMKFYKLEKANSKYDGLELVVIKIDRSDMQVKHVNKEGIRSTIYPHLADSNSFVVINGGYFGYNHKEKLIPLGLEVVDSIQKSSLSKWDIGGVFYEQDSNFVIKPISDFKQDTKLKHAIQSKPIVVYNGEGAIFSKNLKLRNRTAICLDNGGNVLVVGVFNNGTGAMSLFDFAKVLTYKKGEKPLVDVALAMDGGNSSYLYIPSLKRSWGASVPLYVPNVVLFNSKKEDVK